MEDNVIEGVQNFLLAGSIKIKVMPLKGISGFLIVQFSRIAHCERVKAFLIYKMGKEAISGGGKTLSYFYIKKYSLSSSDFDTEEFLKFEESSVASKNKSILQTKLESFANPNSALEKGIAKGDLSLGDDRYLVNGRKKKMPVRNRRVKDKSVIPIVQRKKILTWKEFLNANGYNVYIRTKKNPNGKFLFHDIYFLSPIEKVMEFQNKSYFLRYKFQPCRGKKRKFQIFKEYPDPE